MTLWLALHNDTLRGKNEGKKGRQQRHINILVNPQTIYDLGNGHEKV